jgi:phosphorylcholine metabolism protein LicD
MLENSEHCMLELSKHCMLENSEHYMLENSEHWSTNYNRVAINVENNLQLTAEIKYPSIYVRTQPSV